MNFNEQSFASIMTTSNFIKDHFDRVFEKITAANNNSNKEIKCLSTFLENVHLLSHHFEESLFKNCEDFQKKTKENVKDEQIAHCYQTVINSVLRFADNVQKMNKTILESKILLIDMEKHSRVTQTNTSNLIINNTNEFKTTVHAYENDYRKYIKTLINSSSSTSDLNGQSNQNELLLCKNAEETVLSTFAQMKANFGNNLTCLKVKIDYLGILEAENKKRTKEIALKVGQVIKSLGNKEINQKSENIDLIAMDKNNYFDVLRRESILDFNKSFNFANHQMSFCSYYNFIKLNRIFDSQYARYVMQKHTAIQSKIPTKIRIYIEIFFDFFYKSNSEFSKEIIDELNTLLSEKLTREYFIFSLILKKTQILFMKPFSVLSLKSIQFKNLLLITQYILLHVGKEKKDQEYEVIFSFMKFGLSTFNEKKENLLEKWIMVGDFCVPEFWIGLFEFLTTQNLNGLIDFKVNVQNGKPFFGGIKNIVDNFKSQINQPKIEVKQKVFDEIGYLLFNLKLDFEVITDILIGVAQVANISMESVKSLLGRNQELLATQITKLAEYKIETKQNFNKISKLITKNHKLIAFFCHLVGFCDNASEIFKLTILNKQIYSKSEAILKHVLLEFSFSRFSLVRKHIILLKVDTNHSIEMLIEGNDANEESVISLDVKRTISYNKHFSSKSLQKVLSNISNEEIGHFAYYQGLNYIVTYFLGLFEGNEVITYNFAISILYNYFSAYIDHDLKNIKKLFFYLKGFMALELPQLHHFLDKEQKLDSDIILASWCLTLFTTVTQYTDDCPYLDEIIDIFLSKGWPGFFRIILVIFDELQERIFKMNYEDILMLLSDLCKTNFKELIKTTKGVGLAKDGLPFSFKTKIKKFKKVKKGTMINFQYQYHKLEEKTDEFWHKINKKMKVVGKKN